MGAKQEAPSLQGRERVQPPQQLTVTDLQALHTQAGKDLTRFQRLEAVGLSLIGSHYDFGKRDREEAILKRRTEVAAHIIRAATALQSRIGDFTLPNPSEDVLKAPDTLRVIGIPSAPKRAESGLFNDEHLQLIKNGNAEFPDQEGYYLGVVGGPNLRGDAKQAAKDMGKTLQAASKAYPWIPVMFDVDHRRGAHLRAATLDEVLLLKQLGMVLDNNIGTATKERNTGKYLALTKEGMLVKTDPTDDNFPPVLVIDFRPRSTAAHYLKPSFDEGEPATEPESVASAVDVFNASLLTKGPDGLPLLSPAQRWRAREQRREELASTSKKT